MINTCGAKTRNGGACKKPPLNGKTRCRLHGGKSTGNPNPSKNALTHGIYSRHLTDGELQNADAYKLAKIDDELLIARVRLSRALDAESLAQGEPELDEFTENVGGGEYVPHETKKHKVKDYNAIIDRLIARIESLEKTRLLLTAEDSPSVNDVGGFEVIPYED